MPRQIQKKARTTKPLSKRQSWMLQWFAKATARQRDAVEGCMMAFRRISAGPRLVGRGHRGCAYADERRQR